MAKNFALLRAKRSPESLARTRALVEKYEAEMALDELRVAHQLTQEGLAEVLGMNQASLSKMERQTDMYISTLRSIIRAMGGHLRLEAVFPEGKVTISQFKDLKTTKDSKPKKAGRSAKRTPVRPNRTHSKAAVR
jgi:transcriptional regulator with XRE-family HTH domain